MPRKIFAIIYKANDPKLGGVPENACILAMLTSRPDLICISAYPILQNFIAIFDVFVHKETVITHTALTVFFDWVYLSGYYLIRLN